jgi:hypothetical protein
MAGAIRRSRASLSAICAWDVIRYADGAERAVRSAPSRYLPARPPRAAGPGGCGGCAAQEIWGVQRRANTQVPGLGCGRASCRCGRPLPDRPLAPFPAVAHLQLPGHE